jgi:hypothetical protein
VPLALLSRAGVRQSAPVAMHPEHPPTGPPFTTNDLIDLHLLLQQDNWFGRLQALDGAR